MPSELHDSSIATRPLRAITRLLLRMPAVVTVGGIVLAVVAVAISIRWLGFRTSRLDLLNPRSEYNQRWLAYLEEFGDEDDALVLVEAADRNRLCEAIDELAEQLQRPGRPFDAVISRRDLSSLRRKGLHYFPREELARVEQFVRQVEPIQRGDWNQFNIGTFLKELNLRLTAIGSRRADPSGVGASTTADPAAMQSMLEPLNRISESLAASLAEVPEYRSPWPEMGQLDERLREFDPAYLLSKDERQGFVLLRLIGGPDKLTGKGPAIEELRRILEEIRRRFPGVTVGLTGMPVLEYDEMRSSQVDMTVASVVSLLGVIVLLLAGFGSWRYTWLCVVTLILGMAWSFGFIVISIGHLNLLSVSFAAILIGLGIDFGIHYIARYLQLRQDRLPVEEALQATSIGIGPGVITGALTTAFAFFTAGLTDFTGVAELGVIAGGGILLCLTVALVVLPAMLLMVDRHRDTEEHASALPLEHVLRPIFSNPLLTALFVLAITLAATPGLFRLRYDHNLLNLQPKRLESVEVEKRLIEQSDRSVWFAVSRAPDRATLLAKKTLFEKLSSVERTEEISTLLQPADALKLKRISAIHERLTGLPNAPPIIPVATPQEVVTDLSRLETFLTAMGTQMAPAAVSQNPQAAAASPMFASIKKLAELRERIRAMPPSDFSQRLAFHQQKLAEDLLHQLQVLSGLADPSPPTLDDLPSSLVSRFIGKSGQHLLRVYARGDIWEMERLERFVRDCERVDFEITGHPIQTFYASNQMQRSYIHSAIYSLIAVMIVLVVDFRNLKHSILAAAPLVLGIWQTLGVIGWLGIPLNAANMIVLPLLLGIGIDNGVHVIHDWRTQSGPFRPSNSVTVSMILCSSTTMVGFCSMMFARHEGLRSLGQVLTLGIFLCLLTSLCFLPSVLIWWTRNRPEDDKKNHAASPSSPESETASATVAPSDSRPETSSTKSSETPESPVPNETKTRTRRTRGPSASP